MSQADRIARAAGRKVLHVYREYSSRVERAVSEAGTTCRDGCSHCCHLLAISTLAEAIPITVRLVARADISSIAARIRTELLYLADPGLTWVSHWEAKRPCIFLNASRCDVYKERPAPCRYHYVISDPVNCSHGADNTEVARVDLHQIENLVYGIGARAGQMNVDGTICAGAPIPVAVMWAAALLDDGGPLVRAVGRAMDTHTPLYWARRLAELERTRGRWRPAPDKR